MPIGRRRNVPRTHVQTPTTEIDAAQEAVDQYENEFSVLEEMRESFKEEFPEALAALESLARQEDVVQAKIASAIDLVRAAGETVGDFQCQVKYSTAKYDDVEVTNIVGALENGGDIVQSLVQAGAVKKIVLDKKATSFFATHPTEAQLFQPAWKDRAPMTPAVTAPKISGNLF